MPTNSMVPLLGRGYEKESFLWTSSILMTNKILLLGRSDLLLFSSSPSSLELVARSTLEGSCNRLFRGSTLSDIQGHV